MRAFFFILSLMILNSSCHQEDSGQIIKTSKKNKESVELQVDEEISGKVVSGIYQGTFIAVENEKISGVYNANKNSNNCQFYFKGQYNPKSKVFDIQLRNLVDNEISEGNLKVTGDKVNIISRTNFKIKCPDSINTNGLTLSFSKKSNWMKIAAVTKENTEIFEEPDESMGTGLKFKKNELLCVLEEKNNWYRVENFGKTTNAGWINKDSVE